MRRSGIIRQLTARHGGNEQFVPTIPYWVTSLTVRKQPWKSHSNLPRRQYYGSTMTYPFPTSPSRKFSIKVFQDSRLDDNVQPTTDTSSLLSSITTPSDGIRQKEWDTMKNIRHRESTTASILNETENPVGFMTYSRILEAESALLSWTTEGRSVEGLNNAMRLLKRLIQEQEGQPVATDDDAYFIRPFLVNRVIDCWRISWCHGKDVMEPSVMLPYLQGLHVPLDGRALTMIIDAMLKRGNPVETSMVAQWILDQRMEEAYENRNVRPDSFLLTSVIRAWAKSGRMEGPEMAEGILSLMHDLYDNGWKESGPNLHSYAAVMNAWSHSRHPDGPDAIERLFERLKQTDTPELRPNSIIYSIVIDAWSRCGTVRSTERAVQRLNEMIELSDTPGGNNDDRVIPTANNFSRVMYALVKNGRRKQAEILYKQLQTMYETTGNEALRPNFECQKALLSALSCKDTARQAYVLLEELIEVGMAREGGIMPTRSYFVDVLVALTKDPNPFTGATESEKLLRRMVDIATHSSGFPDLMPDISTFIKVTLAWSKCREKLAVSRVTALLELLEDLYRETGSHTLKPNAKLMEIVVLTLCRSSLPDALERAETIILNMERACTDGDRTMMPSRGIYTTLMQAWAKSDDGRSHSVVQQIFDNLNILYSQGHEAYRPDVVVYSTLMSSLARSGDTTRVQAMFDVMCEEYRLGNTLSKPDMYAFNMILKAWCFSDNPNRGQKADAALRRLSEVNKKLGLNLQPDAYTFLHMIRIWGSTDSPDNAERVEYYLRSMLDSSFDPSFSFCLKALQLWIQKSDGISTGRATILLEDIIMGVQTNKIRIPNPTLYRDFLELVAKSSIDRRNIQAQQLLSRFPKGKVLRSLMPTVRQRSGTTTVSEKGGQNGGGGR